MPSITITYTVQEGNDIAAAVGYTDNLLDSETGQLRAATAAESKQHLINYVKSMVRSHKDWKRKNDLPPIQDINPT